MDPRDERTPHADTDYRLVRIGQELADYEAEHAQFGWRELGDFAVVLRNLSEQLRHVQRETLKTMAAKMPKRVVNIEGSGEFTRRKDTGRTGWKWDELLPVLVARALDERRLNEVTGEYEREAEAVARVLNECISFSGGKVKALRERGVPVGAYCKEEDKGYTVQLPSKPKPSDLDISLGVDDEDAA